MILSLKEALGYTHLFVIIINLRITFKMKVILNCHPKEESEYCEKIKSSSWKGASSPPLWVKPLQVSEGFKQSKDRIYWQTYNHSEKEHFFGDNCSKDSYLKKKQYQSLLKLPDSWEGYEGWIWGLWMSLGTLFCGLSAWHDMVKTTLCPAHRMHQPTPLQIWPTSPYALSWLLFHTSLILNFLSFSEFIHMIYECPHRNICCV